MSKTSLVDVAFRATTLGLFATTLVAGGWFVATATNGFVHYSEASAAVKRAKEESGKLERGGGGR